MKKERNPHPSYSSWTVNEINFLIKHYKEKGLDFCCRNLNKTRSRIVNQLFKMGLDDKLNQDSYYWTDEEIDLLEKYYPNNGIEFCMKKLNKTSGQITSKAHHLGLDREFVYDQNSPKEKLTREFLEQEFVLKKKSIEKIAKENNIKSSTSVTQFLKKFGISRDPIRNSYKYITKEKLVDLYVVQNLSQRDIVRILGLKNRNKLRRLLIEYQIPIRKIEKGNLTQKFKNHFMKKRICGEMTSGYWSGIKKGAKDRELVFDITPEYVWELFIKQERKCVLSGKTLFFAMMGEDKSARTASLDRISSEYGYIVGNVQWVHKDINKMKFDLNQDYFIEMCEIIYKHNKTLNRDKNGN